MWISARTATTFLIVVAALALLGVAAPFVPRPHLPSLPEERAARLFGPKFGLATETVNAPEKIRTQRMAPGTSDLANAARWEDAVGTGPAREPSAEVVRRLVTLLRDARTVADPRAAKAVPTVVVRLVKEGRRADVMLDPTHDLVVVALDGAPAATFNAAALHREYSALVQELLP